MRILNAAVMTVAVGAFASAASAQTGRGGMRVEQRYYPSGDRATSAILLERATPNEVRLGDEFEYLITLTNISRAEITDLSLVEKMPPTFSVKGIAPEPTRGGGDSAAWNIPRFPAGATQTIRVVGSTSRPDELSWCATVTFNTTVCAATKIVEPRIALQKTAPAQVMLCDPIPMRLVVTNTGTGIARGVKIVDSLPPGLTTTDGKQEFAFDAGDLAAGQSREFTFTTRAAQTGSFTNNARATEQGGMSAEASSTTIVVKPELAVTKTCPGVRYLGRTAEFTITVSNPGIAPAENVVLTDQIPPGLEFLGASSEGRPSGGVVTWALGSLAPGASKSVQLSMRAVAIGVVTNTASARAYCAEAATSCQMEVRGIPAILIECVDSPDPVEVGTDTTYTITVTNQGTATGTNIAVEATLPPQEDLVGVNGPTPGEAQGKVVRFAPLPTLAAKARATWTVTVKGVQPADVRFRVTMRSDQMDSNVEETESTHIYE